LFGVVEAVGQLLTTGKQVDSKQSAIDGCVDLWLRGNIKKQGL